MRANAIFLVFTMCSMLFFPPAAGAGPDGRPAERTGGAGAFLWGTEVLPSHLVPLAKRTLENSLPVRVLKIRLQTNNFARTDGRNFAPEMCMPSPSRCIVRTNMDDVARLFRENGWSMIPMISHNPERPFSARDVEEYVDFTDWFISRYKSDAGIKYLELINAPFGWENMPLALLAELQNKVYDRIKGRHPEILVGTPGFEYTVAPQRFYDRSIGEAEFFLDKRNGMKFDFWAFHGYPGRDPRSRNGVLPPTNRSSENKYAGPAGIVEVRQRLDANGWNDRMIIDTEHVNMLSGLKPFISDEDDILTAAYTVQELLIKRALTVNGRSALSGIISLKIAPRGDRHAFLFASLMPDGSPTRTVRAAGLLVSKLKDYGDASHLSGEFDGENQAWVEKFTSGSRELYIFFKPFKFSRGGGLQLDDQPLRYRLTLNGNPASVTLTSLSGETRQLTPSPTVNLDAVTAPQFLEVRYQGAAN